MDTLMTIKEAAEYLRLNYMTVYKLAKKGSIPASKVGGNWRFKKEIIDDWLSQQARGGRETVLIVDDDERVRDLLKEIIWEQGYRVVTAANGESALEAVSKQHFGLIFLDLVLPGLNGVDTLGSIKDRDKDSVVVVVTGYGDDPIALQAMTRGPLLLIRKPFQPNDIVEVLNIALGRRGKAR